MEKKTKKVEAAKKTKDKSEVLKKAIADLKAVEETEDHAKKAAEFLDSLFDLHHDESDFNIKDYLVGDRRQDAMVLLTNDIHVAHISDVDFSKIVAMAYKAVKFAGEALGVAIPFIAAIL